MYAGIVIEFGMEGCHQLVTLTGGHDMAIHFG